MRKSNENKKLMKVVYYSGRETEEMCDLLKKPTYLISNEIKRLFELYDKTIDYKGVQLFPLPVRTLKVRCIGWQDSLWLTACMKVLRNTTMGC